jgi:hypothetical protein
VKNHLKIPVIWKFSPSKIQGHLSCCAQMLGIKKARKKVKPMKYLNFFMLSNRQLFKKILI